MLPSHDWKKFAERTCLVTGGAGAIGSQLVQALVRMGARVVVLDNLSSGHTENLGPALPEVKLIRGSVTSQSDVNAAFAEKPDFVFHLAAHFANQNSIDHPHNDLMTNVVGTQQVLDAARGIRNLQGFVYASSSCVLGNQNGLMTEETRPQPETPYGVSKLAGEHYTLVYASVYGLPAAVVRYFNVFGPGEYPGQYRNVIPNFIHLALHGQALPITGTGMETREFVYVADAVSGTLLAALCPAARGEVFHLGSGQELTIRELAEKIIALDSNRSGIEYYPRRSWDGISKRRTSFEKAKRILGYNPISDFDEGLRITLLWLKELERAQGCVDHTTGEPIRTTATGGLRLPLAARH